MKLWQLINPKTKENLSEPQQLPENWGPIFGLHNIKDRLADLSWLGITDKAWVEVDVPDPVPPPVDYKKLVDEQINFYMSETLPMVAIDNTNITKEKRAEFIEFRRLLSEIPLQVGYPNNVYWPKRPD